ncbi:MAG: PKD domain-containing protein, partial [Sphingobacteriales bacterium]|nr:PKD domain-containing protein [Sphingobacteriales bacterium]
TLAAGTFSSKAFVWNYGDGSANDTLSLAAQQTHTFPAEGTYNITLCVIDPLVCNTNTCTTKTIKIATNVQANFTSPESGCVKLTAAFNSSTSLGGTTYSWDFGDGSTSIDANPVHEYVSAGTYKVKLILIDSNTCNITDIDSAEVVVHPKPIARFTWNPNPPIENTATQFTNTSVNAISYVWHFGYRNDSSTLSDPAYQYNATDSFNTCLEATNIFGCKDTSCQYVKAIVAAILDVPTAFTAGKPGINGIIKVRAFGVKNMTWKIYNRWGQVVFISNDIDNGWDGIYKGVIQPVDVYAYTLEVEFTDGKKLKRTGDITLLK